MRSKFPGYYKPTKEEFEQLWQNALIVLDTNVLLDLYRYSDETVHALLNTIKNLKDRIFIPYRVSLEYHRSLNTTISTQIESYRTTLETLEEFKKQLDAKRSHPFLAKNLHEEIQTFCEKFDEELNKRKKEVESLITENPIKDTIGELLDDKVGDEFDLKELEIIYNEGVKRYLDKIPPGFMDAKNKGKQGNEIYGDLVVWKEVIRKSKDEKVDIILVTGDVKEDWFMKHAGRTIGPRPELVHEFRIATGRLFYMYPTNQFLEYTNEYLKGSINKDILEEVEKVIEKNDGESLLPSNDDNTTIPDGKIGSTEINRGELNSANTSQEHLTNQSDAC